MEQNEKYFEFWRVPNLLQFLILFVYFYNFWIFFFFAYVEKEISQ